MNGSPINRFLTGVAVADLLLLVEFIPFCVHMYLWSEDRTNEEEKYKALIQELCKFRPANEYFRLSAESNCRDVVRCVPNDFIGGHTLAAVRCPTGLLFDLDGQVGKTFL